MEGVAQVQMETALGVDPGKRRVGLAVSDELGFLAHPLETIDTKVLDPIERIAEIAREKSVATIVVGVPRNMDGSYGPAADHAKELINTLRASLTSCKVIGWDERLSTVQASRGLQASGVDARKQKGVIDQAAAVVILQSWLDSRPSL